MHIQNAGRPSCRGLEQQVALPRDSYLQHYFADVTSVMRVGPPLFFVVSAAVAWLLCACMPSICHAPGALCGHGLLACSGATHPHRARCAPMSQLWCFTPAQVQGLNMSRHAPDVNRVCSIAGCDDTSLLNQVRGSSH